MGDFFRDLDKDLAGIKDTGSLFSTLANDLVEFLEEGLKDLESELEAVSDEVEEAARAVKDMYANYSYNPQTGKGSWEPAGASTRRPVWHGSLDIAIASD